MTVGLVQVPQRSAAYVNGSPEWIGADLKLASYNKLSISAWVYWNTFANDDHLAMEYSVNFNAHIGWVWNFNSSSSGSKIDFGINSNPAGASDTIASVARPTAGAWHHYVHLIDFTKTGAAAIPAIYIDGVSQSITSGTVNSLTTNFSDATLYCMCRNGTTLFGPGAMAQLALYGGVLLTSAQVITLYAGNDPRIVAGGPTHFWRLAGPAQSTNLGTSKVAASSGNTGQTMLREGSGAFKLVAAPPQLYAAPFSQPEAMVSAAPAVPASIPSAPQIWSPLTLGAAAWKMGKLIEENRPLTRRGLLLPRRRNIAGTNQ